MAKHLFMRMPDELKMVLSYAGVDHINLIQGIGWIALIYDDSRPMSQCVKKLFSMRITTKKECMVTGFEPRDGSDAALLVFADWLLDNNQEEASQWLRDGLETSTVDSMVIHVNAVYMVRAGQCHGPGRHEPVGCFWTKRVAAPAGQHQTGRSEGVAS